MARLRRELSQLGPGRMIAGIYLVGMVVLIFLRLYS